jgi:predicted unusual protein kinase regulating ubiquinone biosynthesis (AarF/ABC1/UbiB family)
MAPLMMRFLRLLTMARLLLAQDTMLPPGFFTDAPWRVRVARRIFTFMAPRFRDDERGHKLSDRIRRLGPTYIKLGQFLATRPDIIGPAMAHDLTFLQDQLPPFSDKQVRRILAAELDHPDAVISKLSEPIAAASVAQVHQAIHAETGEKLAVKILRPGVEARLKPPNWLCWRDWRLLPRNIFPSPDGCVRLTALRRWRAPSMARPICVWRRRRCRKWARISPI